MAQAPGTVSRSPGEPVTLDLHRASGTLAVDLRTTVTAVVGYLELMSDDERPIAPDVRLRWIATIERRLEAMRELNDEVARVLTVLRGVIADQAAAPPAPAAPEG